MVPSVNTRNGDEYDGGNGFHDPMEGLVGRCDVVVKKEDGQFDEACIDEVEEAVDPHREEAAGDDFHKGRGVLQLAQSGQSASVNKI